MQFWLKSAGYIISIISVFLLGATSWKSASESEPLMACLVLGMATSIAGMALRWLQFYREMREKGKV